MAHVHDVQYITCDHNCVVKAGLMSERVRRVCSAVKNATRSSGEGGGGASGNSDCRGVWFRAMLCLREEKAFDADGDTVDWVGEDGRPGTGLGGEEGGARRVLAAG